jgi:hypothetical protein
MINRPYSFSFLYHEGDSLAYRKQIFQRYASTYFVRLYRLRAGFAFPELLFREKYADQDFVDADGIVVGDKIGVRKSDLPSVANPHGFYQLLTSLQVEKK